MTSRRGLVPALSSISLIGAGFAVVPTAQAATTYVTASTAVTKAVGATTYMWGSSDAPVGTAVCSQVSLSGAWSTSRCSTIKSDHTYTVELTYGKNTPGAYTFHAVTRTSTGAVTATSPSVGLTRTGTSSTPAPIATGTIDYIKGRTTDGYALAAGYNGTKVDLVQKALGVASSPTSTRMGPATTSAVITFQKAHKGLRTDGVVDADTYYALKDYAPYKSYLASYNYDVDKWMAPAALAAGASRADRVKAMAAFATDQLGKPYIWGGTGPVGYDCSGLMIQALRAGGYSPKNVSNLTDVRPTSDLSNQMWLDSEFPKGSLSSPQPGDLVYFGNSDGTVHHVSMYLGGTQFIDAIDTKVQYSYGQFTTNAGWAKTVGINRLP